MIINPLCRLDNSNPVQPLKGRRCGGERAWLGNVRSVFLRRAWGGVAACRCRRGCRDRFAGSTLFSGRRLPKKARRERRQQVARARARTHAACVDAHWFTTTESPDPQQASPEPRPAPITTHPTRLLNNNCANKQCHLAIYTYSTYRQLPTYLYIRLCDETRAEKYLDALQLLRHFITDINQHFSHKSYIFLFSTQSHGYQHYITLV